MQIHEFSWKLWSPEIIVWQNGQNSKEKQELSGRDDKEILTKMEWSQQEA